MSSRNGMKRADVDTGLLHDRKIIMLARRFHSEPETAIGVVLYIGALLASWRENRPMGVVESAPAWLLLDPSPWLQALIDVGLVDPDGRIPETTLDTWMASARAASEKATEAANRRWGKDPEQSRSNARALPKQSASNARAMPGPPAGPTGPIAREHSAARTADSRSLKDIVGDYADIVGPKGE